MRVLERLCPQTWWQWTIYGVMAALLMLNVALSTMPALDAAPQSHSRTPTTAASPTLNADTPSSDPGQELKSVPTARQ